MLLAQPIRQIAYIVRDVRVAAERHTALFGSGPFLVFENLALNVRHQGEKIVEHQSIALGQWGTMQIEFLQQKTTNSSVFRRPFPEGDEKTGLHHVGIIVENLQNAVAEFMAAGFVEALRANLMGTDLTAVFIDSVAAYGHLVELYEASPALMKTWEMVASAAIGFDGRDPVRNAQIG